MIIDNILTARNKMNFFVFVNAVKDQANLSAFDGNFDSVLVFTFTKHSSLK